MANLALNQVVKRYGAAEIIRGIDLRVESGEFVVFVGPSGCGKSTLLRMIAGLEPITEGALTIDGVRMNERAAADRGIAMVFQSYALYPHMSVYKNMAFGLETARAPKREIDARVRKTAEILQIGPLLDRKPKQLSGGQRQRVAIGRALVRDPKIFLFDEPLSNLDAELRAQTRVEIARLHAEIGATMIFVTHDQVEAMTLADRIVVIRAGRIEQHGKPLDIYNNPANRFVAGFIGSPTMNFIDVAAKEQHAGRLTVSYAGRDLSIPTDGARVAAGARLSLGVRPEHVVAGAAGEFSLGQMRIIHVEQLGGQTLAYGHLAEKQKLTVVFDGQKPITAGDVLDVGVNAASLHLFGPDEARLNL